MLKSKRLHYFYIIQLIVYSPNLSILTSFSLLLNFSLSYVFSTSAEYNVSTRSTNITTELSTVNIART